MTRFAILESATVLCIAALLVTTGCVDPEGKLTEFEERLPEPVPPAEGCADRGLPEGVPADISGRFVIGLEVSNLAPGNPVRLISDNVYTGDGTGGELSVLFFPLDKNSGQKVASEDNPGEDAQIPSSGTVDDGGYFETNFVDGEVPAEANPIIPASIKLTINDLCQVTLSENGYCGVFEDAVSSTGTPLVGNLAALRVADDAIGGELPATEDLAYNCELLQVELDGM